jgi:hypothetical protein
VSEILVALREAGIKDLEDLVKRVIGKAQDAEQALDVFAPVADPPSGTSYSHRPPKISFTVGEVSYDPADIKRFDGQPLHLVWRQIGDKPELIGFVGHELVRAITAYAQLRQLGWLAAPAAGYGTLFGGVAGGYYPYPYVPYNPYGPSYGGAKSHVAGILTTEAPSLAVRLWEHANYQGGRLRINANQTCRDLTKIGRGFLSAWDWNDIASSVTAYGSTVLLYEHSDFGGDALLVIPGDQPYTFIDNLATAGWNDRVSSVKNFGKMY